MSLHAIDSAWSLLYLVMVCKSSGLSCCIFPLPLPPSLPLPFPPSLPPSLPRIEKAERAAERKIAKQKQEWDAATKRTAARHNERTESLLPDGKRLHKAKEPTALVPFAGSAPGACHQCGEFGHWRRECPKRVVAGATCPLLHVLSKNAEYTEDRCSGSRVYVRGMKMLIYRKVTFYCHPMVCILLSRVDCILFGGRSLCPSLGVGYA